MSVENSFVYEIAEDCVRIVGFVGSPEYLSIPDELDGAPVAEISDGAFEDCRTLKQILLPGALKRVGADAFAGCSSLECFEAPKGTTELGEGCFRDCSALIYASLPDGITRIPESCFRGCVSLVEIEAPASVTSVGAYAFSGCSSLERLALGKDLNEIGDFAFYGCDALESLYAPGYPRSEAPETGKSLAAPRGDAVVSPEASPNAPTELPDAFGVCGAVFLTAALLSLLRKSHPGKRRNKRRKASGR